MANDHQENAFIELWVNGNKEVDRSYANAQHFNLDDDGKVYMKQGLYHCRLDPSCRYESSDPPMPIYHDGMKVINCPLNYEYYHPDTGKCHTTPPYS